MRLTVAQFSEIVVYDYINPFQSSPFHSSPIQFTSPLIVYSRGTIIHKLFTGITSYCVTWVWGGGGGGAPLHGCSPVASEALYNCLSHKMLVKGLVRAPLIVAQLLPVHTEHLALAAHMSRTLAT